MSNLNNHWVKGFPPLISKDSRVLILGSMPGIASLKAQAYYAHPRNAFWPIMSELFDIDVTATYDQRVSSLLNHRVALWDVLYACERQGSLDSAIQKNSEQVNDFESLFINYPNISAVYCNGGKAWNSYLRYVQKPLGLHDIEAYCLPSTSPAHARLNFTAKLSLWRTVADRLHIN
jgi:TDG/mug DNA glycosylase family protein